MQPTNPVSVNTSPAWPVVVLVTVNKIETHALLDAFVGEGQSPASVPKDGVTYNNLGTHGGCLIVHTICEMGAGGVGASQQRTRDAIDHWHPRAIIAVGIAFGRDETKQNIGDVLVSTQIQDYELGRLNEDATLTPRGDKPGSSDILLNRFRQTDATATRATRDWPKVRFGLVLSGQKLVDNLDYRESLKFLFPEAIGGEMEGAGVYASAGPAKVDWIVVKGICDWGHNKNQVDKDAWQKLAAKNAARVLKAAIDVGGLYCDTSSLPANRAALHADISRIIKNAPAKLIGREDETKLLNAAWQQAIRSETKRPHVLTFVALGGEGKTSLVAKWAAELAHQDWLGCDAVFAWSFYSRSTREQTAVSSDLFLAAALTFFGDPAMAGSAQTAFDKGRRLAQLVGERRALLILDGVEPLQYAPTSRTRGELKDQGVAALLKELAVTNLGLCIVTTRYSIPDLRAYWQTTAPEHELKRLSTKAGVDLLQMLGVRKESGSKEEFETLVEDVKGHALTLNLLGSYLHDAHAGDIRKRDLVKLEEADAEEQGGHAFRVMEAYVRWFESEGEKGKRALAVLRLLGLFDRPATADCLAALQKAPAITDLTEALVGMSEAQRNVVFARLETAKLLAVNRDAAGTLVSLDAHPLLREYFARQLRTQHPGAWRDAHLRLFDYFRSLPTQNLPLSLSDQDILLRAVLHGCLANRHHDALCIYWDRVVADAIAYHDRPYHQRSSEAPQSMLVALSAFFDSPWGKPISSLGEEDKAKAMGEAGHYLFVLGRLSDAERPLREAAKIRRSLNESKQLVLAARDLRLVRELHLLRGELDQAEDLAQQSINAANLSGSWIQRVIAYAGLGQVLHYQGKWNSALVTFRRAEELEKQHAPGEPELVGIAGLWFCEYLFDAANDLASEKGIKDVPEASTGLEHRAQRLLYYARQRAWPMDTAQGYLAAALALRTVSLRAGGCGAIQVLLSHVHRAVEGLRATGQQHHLVNALLASAVIRAEASDLDGSQRDLNEGWEIAGRGPMKLFMADIHLHRARLFGSQKPDASGQKYPWKSPQDDLAAAEKLINECGYHRRDEELADAKKVILS